MRSTETVVDHPKPVHLSTEREGFLTALPTVQIFAGSKWSHLLTTHLEIVSFLFWHYNVITSFPCSPSSLQSFPYITSCSLSNSHFLLCRLGQRWGRGRCYNNRIGFSSSWILVSCFLFWKAWIYFPSWAVQHFLLILGPAENECVYSLLILSWTTD